MTSSASAASARLGVLTAPAGLCVVQDLANSAAIPAAGVPDLLQDRGSASAWLDETLDVWSRQTGGRRPPLSLAERDLEGLRDGRDLTRAWLGGEDVDLPATSVVLRAHGGAVTYEPRDDGAAGILGLVAAELLLAGRDGTGARLKTCANPACGAAFYDLSRNGSRVWHDVKTCGNVTNLRASRARRRAAAGEQAEA